MTYINYKHSEDFIFYCINNTVISNPDPIPRTARYFLQPDGLGSEVRWLIAFTMRLKCGGEILPNCFWAWRSITSWYIIFCAWT